MAHIQLFSESLFDRLFQHNIVSTNGYVKANKEELYGFRDFLVREAKDKTAALHKKRKELLDEALYLFKQDDLSREETKKLVLILRQ
ncbi:uncharacterized protein TNCT_81941 [Trichonephila clavata]|uniref:Uncharacterized protein n=1 Tax=Trichonephila clavata TaxID=2740835 RepID=A0A8X6LZL7_TRICU|nr:uncharacterized protein TNCT_81941 [Trichonephila clavata]